MSMKAMEWARKVEGIDFTAKYVLVMLAGFHNAKTGQCNPSMETLAGQCLMTERPMKNALRRLEAAGLIQPVGSRKGGRAKSIMWAFNAPTSAGVIRPTAARKGVTSAPRLYVVKGVAHETPFGGQQSASKGGVDSTPDKGKFSKRSSQGFGMDRAEGWA
jgi:pyocin large subunit-like protein